MSTIGKIRPRVVTDDDDDDDTLAVWYDCIGRNEDDGSASACNSMVGKLAYEFGKPV